MACHLCVSWPNTHWCDASWVSKQERIPLWYTPTSEEHLLDSHMHLWGVTRNQDADKDSRRLLSRDSQLWFSPLWSVFFSVPFLSILLKQHHLLWIVLTIWGSIPIILSRHMLKSSACWITKMLAKLTWGVCKDSSANGSNDICPRV